MTELPKILQAPKTCGECAFIVDVRVPKDPWCEFQTLTLISPRVQTHSRPNWCPLAAMEKAAVEYAERAVFEYELNNAKDENAETGFVMHYRNTGDLYRDNKKYTVEWMLENICEEGWRSQLNSLAVVGLMIFGEGK